MKAIILLDDIENVEFITADVKLRFEGDVVGIYDGIQLKPVSEKIFKKLSKEVEQCSG